MSYKIVVDGPCGAGKSNFLRLLSGQPFREEHEQTIGLDFMSVVLNDKKYCVFELAGGEKMRQLSRKHLSNADAYIIIFDASQDWSINYAAQLREYARMVDRQKQLRVIMLANKKDIGVSGAVNGLKQSLQDGQSLFETSLKLQPQTPKQVVSLLLGPIASQPKRPFSLNSLLHLMPALILVILVYIAF